MLVAPIEIIKTYDAKHLALSFGIKLEEARILKTGAPVAVFDAAAEKLIAAGLAKAVESEKTAATAEAPAESEIE
jgi:hypothetical protein